MDSELIQDATKVVEFLTTHVIIPEPVQDEDKKEWIASCRVPFAFNYWLDRPLTVVEMRKSHAPNAVTSHRQFAQLPVTPQEASTLKAFKITLLKSDFMEWETYLQWAQSIGLSLKYPIDSIFDAIQSQLTHHNPKSPSLVTDPKHSIVWWTNRPFHLAIRCVLDTIEIFGNAIVSNSPHHPYQTSTQQQQQQPKRKDCCVIL